MNHYKLPAKVDAYVVVFLSKFTLSNRVLVRKTVMQIIQFSKQRDKYIVQKKIKPNQK